jgi:hypothetical protein
VRVKLLNKRAVACQEAGDLAAAQPLFEEALAINRAALPARHPHIAVSLGNLAALLEAGGELAAAQQLYGEAIIALPAGHLDMFLYVFKLAVLLCKRDKAATASGLLRQEAVLVSARNTPGVLSNAQRLGVDMGDTQALHAMLMHDATARARPAATGAGAELVELLPVLGSAAVQQGGGVASGIGGNPMTALVAMPGSGCTKEGEEDTMVQDDRDEAPFKVQGPRGDTSWFREEQLGRADGARADGSTRPAAGDKVVLQETAACRGAAAFGDIELQAEGYAGEHASMLGMFKLQEEMVQGRPTYKKPGRDEFLFYTTDSWMVGPDTGNAAGYWLVRSAATMPGAITEVWSVADNSGGWNEVAAAKIVKATAAMRAEATAAAAAEGASDVGGSDSNAHHAVVSVDHVLPAGTSPGDSVRLQLPWGQTIEVQVPEGATAGATLNLQIPVPPQVLAAMQRHQAAAGQ